MRLVEKLQLNLDEIDISAIMIDLKSRDNISQVLRGLKYIWSNKKLKKDIFDLLEEKIKVNGSKTKGRNGMCLWNILVMGVIRLNLNIDYDWLHNEVNNHKQIRQMLGHGDIFDTHQYSLQTIKDNVSLLSVELLDEINQIIVKAGHEVLNKKETALKARCDSFVCKRNVHYPTDINLLLDACRKVITLIKELCEEHKVSGWRQSEYNLQSLRKLMRKAQQSKKGGSRTEKQKIAKEERVVDAHQLYITQANNYIKKARKSLAAIEGKAEICKITKYLIEQYLSDTDRQIEQIRCRVIEGEVIPHEEKVFSIFERDTEWISKGKAGVPVELGIRVCIVEDQHQFILHHQVMRKQTDDQVAVPIITETKKRYSLLATCSFDKGFHSPKNQEELSKELTVAALSPKGKLSKKNKELQSSTEWQSAKKNHSTVESCINGLQVNALDMCPDKGKKHFDLYVSLAVVSRNLQRLGVILIKKERKQKLRTKRQELRLAA